MYSIIILFYFILFYFHFNLTSIGGDGVGRSILKG